MSLKGIMNKAIMALITMIVLAQFVLNTAAMLATGDTNSGSKLPLVDAARHEKKQVGGHSGYEIIYAKPDTNCNERAGTAGALHMAKHARGFKEYETIYGCYIEKTFEIPNSNATIHTLQKKGTNPQEFYVLLPGTGLNSTINFFVNENKSMAEFLADKGVLVVGVDYAETNIEYDPLGDYTYMAQMGISQHTVDVEKSIKFVQKKTDILKYSVVGHSLGGLIGLDLASKHPGDGNLKMLYVLDMAGTLNASQEPQLVQSQRDNYNATVAMIGSGQTVNFEMLGLAEIAAKTKSDPFGDSGIPNPYVPGTNLTNYEYLIVASIYTGQMPGNEIFVQGFFAGDLVNGLSLTPEETVLDIASGGKIYPLKVNEDVYGIYAKVPGSYQIQWSDIKVPVKWVNLELGIGSRGQETANLIKQGGNENVCFSIVAGYAHADGVYSLTAEEDVWNLLFQPAC